MCQLQRLRIFDQDAVLRRHTRSRHDGHRRGQAQRTRAGNHQHRHRSNEGHLNRLARQHPAGQSCQCYQQNYGHKYGTDLVHQALYRRFCDLRVFHQADDVRQHGLCAHRRQAHQHATIAVDAATMDSHTHLLGHGHGFTGQHGFVGLGLALAYLAIGCKTLAGFDHHHIAHQELGHRHIDFAIGAQPMRARGTQGVQCPYGRSGLAFGTHFQPFAQQHQRNHQGRAFEIQMHHGALWRPQPQPDRQSPARRSAQHHQQIHIAAGRSQRVPSGPVKARSEKKLHRRCQRKLPGGRQHPMPPKQTAQHGQDQGNGQGKTPGHWGKALPGRGLGGI